MKNAALIITIFSVGLFLFSCDPPTPSPAECSTLPADQIQFGTGTYTLSYNNTLNWGPHMFKIQLAGSNGSGTVQPEIIIYDGVAAPNSVPEVGSYSYVNMFEMDTAATYNWFTYVVTYTNPYDFTPDSNAVQTFEVISVGDSTANVCLNGKVYEYSNPSNTKEIKLRVNNVPFY
jgi:hypothetical protein